MDDLAQITVDSIDAGENPRHVDDQSPEFAELVASIESRGVLTPILVTPENDRFRIIAGERRWRAAQRAGLTSIPAMVREEAPENAMIDSVIENLHREDMKPSEEAEAIRKVAEPFGLTQKEVAQAISRSPKWVATRWRLHELPPTVQAAVDAGKFPVASIPVVAKWGHAGEAILLALTREAMEENLLPEHLRPDELANAVTWLDRTSDDLVMIRATKEGYGGIRYEYLPVSDELKAEAQVLGWVGFDQTDVDAAKAYGCLLTVKTGKGQPDQWWITDRDFIADRVKQKVVAAQKADEEARKATEAERVPSGNSDDAATADPEADAEQAKIAEKEARAKERTKLLRKQVKAQKRNLELGSRSRVELARPKLTMEVMRLLTALAFRNGAGYELATRAGYCHEDLHEAEWKQRKSDGEQTVKVIPDSAAAAKDLEARMEKAKTPNALLGIVLQTLIEAHYADEEPTPQSRRVHAQWLGSEAEKLIRQIADEAGVLPDGLRP